VTEHPEHPERGIRRWGPREGFAPGYKAYHEVHITKDLGPERNEDLIVFINKHITEFKGKTEGRHGIPLMLFEKKEDAQKFANELSERLNIHKEHVTVKARKYTR